MRATPERVLSLENRLARSRRRWTIDEVHALIQIAALMGVANTEGAPRRKPKGEEFSVPIYLKSGRSARGVPVASIASVRADRDGSLVGLRDGAQLADDRPLRWWQRSPCRESGGVGRPDLDKAKMLRSAEFTAQD